MGSDLIVITWFKVMLEMVLFIERNKLWNEWCDSWFVLECMIGSDYNSSFILALLWVGNFRQKFWALLCFVFKLILRLFMVCIDGFLIGVRRGIERWYGIGDEYGWERNRKGMECLWGVCECVGQWWECFTSVDLGVEE